MGAVKEPKWNIICVYSQGGCCKEAKMDTYLHKRKNKASNYLGTSILRTHRAHYIALV